MRQQQAVEAIRETGGRVYYDYEMDRRASNIELQWPAPAWLENLVGEDFLADAVQIDFACPEDVDDSVLEHVGCLTKLERLDLACTKVTDAGLEQLAGLANLYSLKLDHTQVTDAGLESLKGLNLESVGLFDTNVTEEGIKELQDALAMPHSDVEATSLSNIP